MRDRTSGVPILTQELDAIGKNLWSDQVLDRLDPAVLVILRLSEYMALQDVCDLPFAPKVYRMSVGGMISIGIETGKVLVPYGVWLQVEEAHYQMRLKSLSEDAHYPKSHLFWQPKTFFPLTPKYVLACLRNAIQSANAA